jgi:hypothetical protein
MRQILGTLAALLALAGCGESGQVDHDGADAASEPARRVTLVSGTAAGGAVARSATWVSDDDAAAAYLADFRPPFAHKLGRAIDRLRGDGEVLASVVAVGCGVPESARVVETNGGYAFVAAEVASPLRECFAPVTTVALATVRPRQ